MRHSCFFPMKITVCLTKLPGCNLKSYMKKKTHTTLGLLLRVMLEEKWSACLLSFLLRHQRRFFTTRQPLLFCDKLELSIMSWKQPHNEQMISFLEENKPLWSQGTIMEDIIAHVLAGLVIFVIFRFNEAIICKLVRLKTHVNCLFWAMKRFASLWFVGSEE